MQNIDAKGLFESLTSGSTFLLIDVRQPEELQHGVIPGSVSFPVSDIPRRIDELEKLIADQDKKTKIVIYCRVGGRSEQVINVLEQRGARELYNLVGGTQKYSEFDSAVSRY